MNQIATHPALKSSKLREGFLMLWRDKFAFLSALLLLGVVAMAILGPSILPDEALKMNLRGRNLPPFEWENGLSLIHI